MPKFLAGAAASVVLAFAMPAAAAPTDLTGWTAEGSGSWTRAPGNNAVTQNVNGSPTVFYSDFDSFARSLKGTITVNTSSDDDFIGFVLGFNPGDVTRPATDFLLVDWKQANQSPARVGLAVSRVTGGLPESNDVWEHVGTVQELARGATLGSVGWADFVTYDFELRYTASNLQVFVDGVQQIDLDGVFNNGRFGFYNYSQQSVTYAGITDAVLPPTGVPEPATWALMILGFGAIGGVLRRRSSTVRDAIA